MYLRNLSWPYGKMPSQCRNMIRPHREPGYYIITLINLYDRQKRIYVFKWTASMQSKQNKPQRDVYKQLTALTEQGTQQKYKQTKLKSVPQTWVLLNFFSWHNCLSYEVHLHPKYQTGFLWDIFDCLSLKSIVVYLGSKVEINFLPFSETRSKYINACNIIVLIVRSQSPNQSKWHSDCT